MLKVQTTKLGNVAVLTVHGKIVRGETYQLRRSVSEQTDKSVIVLDLGRVDTIDARGLGVLLEIRAHTQEMGIELRLRNVSKLINQILEITRLDSIFELASGSGLRAPAPGPRAPLMQLAKCA